MEMKALLKCKYLSWFIAALALTIGTLTFFRVFGTWQKSRSDIFRYLNMIPTEATILSGKPPMQPQNQFPEAPGIVILATWRSGSTFLGDLLTSHPSTFLHYEPFLYKWMSRVHPHDRDVKASVNHLKSLLRCDYHNADPHFLNQALKNPTMYKLSNDLWRSCANEVGNSLQRCKEAVFSTQETLCKKLPVQLIKTVRLKAILAKQILMDERLKETKMILLIRDPRGTMESRSPLYWCSKRKPECSDPSSLCQDLVDDYEAAKILTTKFPNNFMLVRYEDIMLNVTREAEKILDFVELEMHDDVKTFIETHTVSNEGGIASTFRDSSKAPYMWKFKTPFEKAVTIQNSCQKEMALWGYHAYDNEEDMRKDDKSSVLPFEGLFRPH